MKKRNIREKKEEGRLRIDHGILAGRQAGRLHTKVSTVFPEPDPGSVPPSFLPGSKSGSKSGFQREGQVPRRHGRQAGRRQVRWQAGAGMDILPEKPNPVKESFQGFQSKDSKWNGMERNK